MKTKILIISLLLMASLIRSQSTEQNSGAKIITASQTTEQNNFSVQVGKAYLGENRNSTQRIKQPLDVRFPWDVLYLYSTFSEEAFDVSKGYFGDKILISWEIRNNLNLINYIKIYRKELGSVGDYTFVANVTSTATEYEDKYVEGGILYEYKIVADGVSAIEEEYNTYITGIGYRSPTAIVTGNISFKGGNPVKDVTVRAASENSLSNKENSLFIPELGQLEILGLNRPIQNEFTIQAWLKPQGNLNIGTDEIRMFKLESEDSNIETKITLSATNKLEIKVNNEIFEIQNYYPSGEIDSKGNDVFESISEFHQNFVHFSIIIKNGEALQLFINGRPMNQTYRDDAHANLAKEIPNNNDPYFEITTPSNSFNLSPNSNGYHSIFFGGDFASYFDEIRVWNKAISPKEIRTDYRRYLGGNDQRLISYLRANEGSGNFAYDISRNGFNYNKNHGELWSFSTIETNKVAWESSIENVPKASQLGILGVTDVNGNYEIAAIPYSGTGESFTITPSQGVHQFEPNQQLVFLGEGSEVINKIDFIDKSSFVFKGQILADSRGVFKSFKEVNGINDDSSIAGPGILDEGYNYYEKNGLKYNKGEYWMNTSRDSLHKYARIPSVGANIYIDNEIVLDDNNIPIESDDQGRFEISVPIGNHYISVKKQGFQFAHSGRYPARDGDLKEFFEDAQETINFVDQTRVTLVGRVVGGSVESDKEIGFGDQGIYEITETDDDGIETKKSISSVNNIGIAQIELGYKPFIGNITDYTKFNFKTNVESGEYRVDLIPLSYSMNQDTGLKILSNSNINLLDSNEDLNFGKVEITKTPSFENSDGQVIEGKDYHYEKSFTYRSTPVVKVSKQESEEEIVIENVAYKTEGMEYPIYSQFATYQIMLDRFERYTNNDDNNIIEFTVPVTDGELIVTNNMALAGSESLEVDANDSSKLTYTFRGGLPTISSPFTKTINIKYRINGVDYEAENYNSEGIVLGGQSDGSQTFITAAPDVPDIILRDPPGSNSSASIEEGQSFTFTRDEERTISGGVEVKADLFLGVRFGAGGGLAGPAVESETTNNLKLGIKTTATSKRGKSISKTYSFSQTISTSDDPDFVGSEGDLYIGNSNNHFYGTFDKVGATNSLPDSGSYTLTNSSNESVFISKDKAMYFVEEPSETFFIYSQKHILETLIPDLQAIVDNYDAQVPSPPLSKAQYEEQINLWRKTILENERIKYRVMNDRAMYKQQLLDSIDLYLEEIEDFTIVGDNILFNKNAADSLKILVDRDFERNVSFDAGVGEFSRSFETTTVKKHSIDREFEVEASVGIELGFQFNKFGFKSEITGFISHSINRKNTTEDTSTLKISYTLKDNDPDNFLSVDVINVFDTGGPVFSVLGGRTSCPYEDVELTHFYNHSTYDPDNSNIAELAEGDREQLSFATQKVEVPLISTEIADISNVLEGTNAEYVLILENNSVSETDADFLLKVDNLSNPNNALINIEPNGTVVTVPYGQKVEYALTLGKSISDVYDYENIRILLQSTCDGESVSDDVFISAHFIPSCTEVVIDRPLENWVYNREIAYNNDGSTNPLKIDLIGFNTTFESFHKIDLEYRSATSAFWTKLKTYYGTQEEYDRAINGGATADQIELITDATISYNWNIAEKQLADGLYEIRARSTCHNGTEFLSEPTVGSIDLTSPQQFGTPLPIDGILGAGEDLKVSFNENIFYNSAISTIEIKGETNQLPIDHSVSLYFSGSNNNAIIENPRLTTGDLSIEFWMNNATVEPTATIIDQQNGLNIRLENGIMHATLGDVSVNGAVANDNLFHHYTITHDNGSGSLNIFEDDKDLGGNTGSPNTEFTNNNSLVIGGNTFIGNIHDLRIWNKSISLSNAYANMYTQLLGNESNLIGFWPMNEGRGSIANDLARFKHADINASWDIKPKGDSYEFTNGQYLELDNVDYVQLTREMNATISFWVKTGKAQEATLFSNGRGNGSDPTQSNGLTNKWAISLNNSGILLLESEGNTHQLTSESLVDNKWHHIAIAFNRNGALKTYIDMDQVSSNQIETIGGFSGNRIWIGARGYKDLGGIQTVDQAFSGKIDEFRLWNTLRNEEQISRDRYNEMDAESIGLLLYARMNAPEPASGNGPRYYHAYSNETVIPSNAIVSSGSVTYSNDTPAIKPERSLIQFQVNHIINEDDMILEPLVSDWSALEGQILDITVHSMYDASNNKQQSPVTWSAFVQKNDMSWFAEGHDDIIDIVKVGDDSPSFEITIINKGGQEQAYQITGIPNWLTLNNTSGNLSPNSSKVILATIDEDLSSGDYIENLYLETNFGLDEKLQLEVSAIGDPPDWNTNASSFDYSMNIIGKVKINGVFSKDSFDMIAAFYDEELRGDAKLIYNESYQEYFAYLTIYSNNTSGEPIKFKIWDASQDKVIQATLDKEDQILFKENEVIGTLSNSSIFESTNVEEQILTLNSGWSWISLNVIDDNFIDINELTKDLILENNDRILSHSPAGLETYHRNTFDASLSGWDGTISNRGGLQTDKMYKVFTASSQTLTIQGPKIDVSSWSFQINENWNWLPYPLSQNNTINESLANFDPIEGDVIKSQHQFAIYDPNVGWAGTLDYLEVGLGYMINSSSTQEFMYPNILNKASSTSKFKKNSTDKMQLEFMKYSSNMNAVVLLPKGYNELLIYDENNLLRGETTAVNINNKNIGFLTVFGEQTENLTFYISNGANRLKTTKSILYTKNKVLGTISKPIILENEIFNGVNVYPNPFESAFNIKLDAINNQNANIKIFNTINQLILSRNYELIKGQNVIQLDVSLATGVYFLQININGNTSVHRILKK